MTLKSHLKNQYARIPSWARRSMGVLLGLTLAFIALLTVAIYVNHKEGGLRRQVSLTGYNYTDRPVHIFSVNGVMGGNIFRDGGEVVQLAAQLSPLAKLSKLITN